MTPFSEVPCKRSDTPADGHREEIIMTQNHYHGVRGDGGKLG